MKRAVTVLPAIGVLAAALLSTVVPAPLTSAQTPILREGQYNLVRRETKMPPDDWTAASIPTHMRTLYILPGSIYMWGEGETAYYSDYRVAFRDTPQGRVTTISLCHRFAGDVLPSGAMTEIRLGNIHNGASQRFVLQGPIANPRPTVPRQKMTCRDEHWPAVQLQEAAWSGPLLASAQAAGAPVQPAAVMAQASGSTESTLQTETERVVDGEMLLAFDRDADLWICLMRRGYPSLEFSELPNGARQEVFVWPDGRFRVRVRAAAYRVSLLASECGTAPRVADVVTVEAAPPSAEEKIVVACLTGQAVFERCRSWWLPRP
jgi:hypothetical protein